MLGLKGPVAGIEGQGRHPGVRPGLRIELAERRGLAVGEVGVDDIRDQRPWPVARLEGAHEGEVEVGECVAAAALDLDGAAPGVDRRGHAGQPGIGREREAPVRTLAGTLAGTLASALASALAQSHAGGDSRGGGKHEKAGDGRLHGRILLRATVRAVLSTGRRGPHRAGAWRSRSRSCRAGAQPSAGRRAGRGRGTR